MRGPRVRSAVVAVTAVLALALAGCGSDDKDGPNDVIAGMRERQEARAAVSSSGQAPATAPAATATCSPGPQVSYAPGALPAPGRMPAGTLMAEIATRGYLVVGVSGDTRLLGARNSLAGGQLEGFDIEIAKAVGRAIFGRDDRVQFKVITAAERGPLVNKGVKAGGVDMVARAMTMNCDRWKSVAFSAVYFNAEQIMLVGKGEPATVKELAAKQAKVCAPTSSTSLEKIQTIKGIQPVAVAIHSDCLALWQEGRVDAITGDDAILAGFKDQDPRAQLGTEKLGAQPYGLAVAKNHPEFARFLNAVLASPAGKAAWTKAYADSGLATTLGAKTQPAPSYGR